MIALQASGDELFFSVRVTPRGGRDVVLPFEVGDTLIKIKVSAPPEDGKANAAVVALLSKALDLPKRRIRVVSGETSRQKRIALVLEQDSTEAMLGKLAKAIESLPEQCFIS